MELLMRSDVTDLDIENGPAKGRLDVHRRNKHQRPKRI